jgi:NAD(P)H dehydrogenase (quinone)
MIIVTGATGRLGSQIVTHLLARVPATRIGVSVRDPEKAKTLQAQGVRVRRGDFADPGSLAHAFEGATQVLVVSADSTGPALVGQHVAAIDAAVDAGARRILYTSHQAAARDSLFAPMADHAATEQHLAGTGVPYTALRNGFYAATIPWLAGPAAETGELIAPADGQVSWTAHADLAEAAAIILADEGRFDGPTPPLTAPETLDLADVARILGERAGRPVRRVVAGDDGFEPELLLGMFRAARRGEFAVTDPTLEALLGRPAALF